VTLKSSRILVEIRHSLFGSKEGKYNRCDLDINSKLLKNAYNFSFHLAVAHDRIADKTLNTFIHEEDLVSLMMERIIIFSYTVPNLNRVHNICIAYIHYTCIYSRDRWLKIVLILCYILFLIRRVRKNLYKNISSKRDGKHMACRTVFIPI
jgi:hypothetical protein